MQLPTRHQFKRARALWHQRGWRLGTSMGLMFMCCLLVCTLLVVTWKALQRSTWLFPIQPSVLDDAQRIAFERGEGLFKSDYEAEDTSTTIIFNVFKREPVALERQLAAAASQLRVQPPAIWVMCFNSTRQDEYQGVVEQFRSNYTNVSLTVSDYNFKFHGRFLLAYMATSKYVLVVDDDKHIDNTTVSDFIRYMKRQPGVWGNNGHLRASTFEDYKSWPNVGYDLDKVDMAEQDYLSGMWFLEQRWLEYFMKERMPSWETAEDMHLSHVMRKYLNLNTYGGKVALGEDDPVDLDNAATTGLALHLREYIFDHQLGRGNKVAGVDQPIDSLLYAESASDIRRFSGLLQACHSVETVGSEEEQVSLCDIVGKMAVLFRGASDQNVTEMTAAAEGLCDQTNCKYYSVKPTIQHIIKMFNMREGFGQDGTEIPWQTGAADVLMSSVGVLNNVLPRRVFVPAATLPPNDKLAGQQNQHLVYHSTIRLALDIHRNSQINFKSTTIDSRSRPAFPVHMEVYLWRRNADGSDNISLISPPYSAVPCES